MSEKKEQILLITTVNQNNHLLPSCALWELSLQTAFLNGVSS